MIISPILTTSLLSAHRVTVRVRGVHMVSMSHVHGKISTYCLKVISSMSDISFGLNQSDELANVVSETIGIR